MTEPVQQITAQNFIRLGIAAFKEHELREIVKTLAKVIGDDVPGVAQGAGILPIPIEWARPYGETFEEMRANVWKSGLAVKGDTILIWINEGDFIHACMVCGAKEHRQNADPVSTLPSTHQSAPDFSASHDSRERLPSSDAAGSGADTDRYDDLIARLQRKPDTFSDATRIMEEAADVLIAMSRRSFDNSAHPSDEWCEAYLRATREWIEPHEAETECGVPIECEITQEWANELNAGSIKAVREGYIAACAVTRPDRGGADAT